MRKALGMAVAMLLVVAGSASAQVSATVSADVRAALSLAKNADVNFGIVNTSSTTTLNPTAPTAGQTAGKFTAGGTGTSTIVVTWTSASPTGSTYTPSVYSNGTDAAASATVIAASGNTVALVGGARFFYVGGSLVAPATAGVINDGSFTLTVTYQ